MACAHLNESATALYAQGAGLGASKGKDISKATNPFDYASNVKDSVGFSFVTVVNATLMRVFQARDRYQS